MNQPAGHSSKASAPRQRNRQRDRLSAAEFTVLGMIARNTRTDGHVHGYDLHRQMMEGPVARIIRLEPGMLYHYLKKLATRELITTTVEQQEGRPDRHLHALTAAGRSAFDEWIGAPVQATREMRIDFLLKLWFTRTLDPERSDQLVNNQRTVIQGLIESLETQQRSLPDDDSDDRFARKVIDLRLAQNRAAAAWLEELTGETS